MFSVPASLEHTAAHRVLHGIPSFPPSLPLSLPTLLPSLHVGRDDASKKAERLLRRLGRAVTVSRPPLWSGRETSLKVKTLPRTDGPQLSEVPPPLDNLR